MDELSYFTNLKKVIKEHKTTSFKDPSIPINLVDQLY